MDDVSIVVIIALIVIALRNRVSVEVKGNDNILNRGNSGTIIITITFKSNASL